MSYDLLFQSAEPPGLGEFEDHFASRSHVTMNDEQAWYQNEDTGVYFFFALRDSAEEVDPDEPDHWALFNLNFFRPRYFTDEAAIELEAFAARFGSKVFDPQLDGMGDGDFSVEGFLRGWHAGNGVSCHRFVPSEVFPAPPVRPADELQRIWRWNYRRKAMQEELGEDVFVPRIGLYEYEGALHSCSIWTDGIPVVLPETDAVLVYRDHYAPRRLFKKKPGLSFAPWREVEPLFDGYRTEASPFPHHFLDYTETPEEIVAWVCGLSPVEGLEGVPMDRVLDADLFEPVGAAGG